jgi:hypothetical protein
MSSGFRSRISTLGVIIVGACSPDAGVATSHQALNADPSLHDFVVYAQQRATLGAHAIVSGGDVGVASLAPTNIGPQLVVSDHAQVDPTHNLIAPSVALSAHASVGDVQTNNLTNGGANFASVGPFPATMPPLPLALTSTTTGADVTIQAGQSVTLSPGVYGSLSVANLGVLHVAGGTYYFKSISLGDHVTFDSASAALVQVTGNIAVGSHTTIGGASADVKPKYGPSITPFLTNKLHPRISPTLPSTTAASTSLAHGNKVEHPTECAS